MQAFPYNLKIEAASEAEADTKMRAVSVLLKKLKANELAKLADVVENNPMKTALAKKALGL
jgi:hypothetical protein